MSKTDSQKFGDLGEKIAEKTLLDNEYEKVRNLNEEKTNFPYADIYAEKGGEKYVISVKARLRFGGMENGKENLSYNLAFGGGDELAKKVEGEYNAKAYWMTVTVDDREWKYSVYFGSLEELEGSRAISISKCRNGDIGQCFVKEELLPQDWDKEVKRIFKKD